MNHINKIWQRLNKILKCSSKHQNYENLRTIPIFRRRKACTLLQQCLIHTKRFDYHSLLGKYCL